MGVSLREVVEAGGYDISTPDDARWLLSKQDEFDELVLDAETTLEEADNDQS